MRCGKPVGKRSPVESKQTTKDAMIFNATSFTLSVLFQQMLRTVTNDNSIQTYAGWCVIGKTEIKISAVLNAALRQFSIPRTACESVRSLQLTGNGRPQGALNTQPAVASFMKPAASLTGMQGSEQKRSGVL